VTVHFTIEPHDQGSRLGWELTGPPSTPDEQVPRMKRRVDELINRDLRLSYGQ
jgi:hypothetical protein